MPTKGHTSQLSNIEFCSTLNKYIPSLVLTQLINRQEKNQGPTSQLPELQPMTTVCLFADISGFTNVSEACAKKGVRGNEELAFCINRYMEGMVKHLGKYGGDIIKFVGDAMIVMWPPEQQIAGQSPEDSASLTVRKAIQCALDIQKDMNNFKVIAGVTSLSVKIGIGYGNCALLYVGGVFGRAEFFTVGPALTYALKSEENATAGGQIIVSETAFKYVRRFYSSEELTNDHGEKFYKINKLVGEGVKTRADALVLRSNISAETYHKIAAQLRGCVPAAIIPYLQIGSEEFGSETRSLTVMFASLGVELSSAETKEGMEKIQKIVVTVQQQVYRQEGSVNKLVMDDKGSTLICLWGLTPMGHADDAARAILTAFNMRKELKKIEGTWCNIGISSGELFSGVVGTSGGRKEFSVLGDIANLAARVMYWPKKHGQKGKIHVDLNTRALASNQFSFIYQGHQEFKGKSISIPIFEPVDPLEEQIQITKKILSPDVFLKPHMNPMCLERSTEGKKSKLKLVGPGQVAVEDIATEVIEYFQQNNTQKPYLASIKGELGSGKTLFARCLIDQLTLSDDFNDMMNGKQSIFCSSLNSESQFQFLNIWRPILQQMMTWYCKKENLVREQVLETVLRTGEGFEQNQNKCTVMCHLLGVDLDVVPKLTSYKQVQPAFRMFPFVMREVYEDKVQIIELLTNFVKIVIGEQDDISIENESDDLRSQLKVKEEMYPILIVLDSVHLMDSPSWLFYESIREKCFRIGIILLQLCNDRGEIQVNQEAQAQFEQVWNAKGMEDLHLIELPVLDQQTLLTLLKSTAVKYQQTYQEEIAKMIEIVNQNDTIKTEEMGKTWKDILTKKWQVENKFIDVSADSSFITKVIVQRCAGNPLLSLYFYVSLLQNGFVTIDTNGLLMSTGKLQQCLKLNDFATVPVPRFSIKNNVAMIDQFLKSINNKAQKKPGELEACVKAIVMMKAATVLGDEFDLKALKAVNPLRYPESVESLKHYLKLLEAHDFIEILDETEKDNLICRFNKPFLRETLYQIVLYRDQKKGMHGAAAQYLLHNQMSLVGGTQERDPDTQAEILKHHMIVSQDIEVEGELSYQARTGLYVSRIQNILNKDPKAMIKKEYIYKQGKGANKKTSKRLVTINQQFFRWYHDEEELKNHTYLGSVPIQFIFQTVASKMARGNMAAFSLSTSSWFNKQQQEEGMRDFFFACDSDLQMEDWIITIEFLRTKAVYDAYASKNIPVQFPIKSSSDKKQKEENQDWSSLIYDFGGQLKQQTSMQIKNNTSYQGASFQNQNKSRISGAQMMANYNSVKDQQMQVSELLKATKALYGAAILSFSHHLKQTSTKMTVKQQAAQIGQIPDSVQTRIRDQISGLLNDQQQSVYYSNRTNSQENQKSQKLTDESKEETQRKKISGVKVSERRGSSISADNVAKQIEENQKYYNKTDLIHEEEEDQTSDELKADSQKVKKEARKSDVVQHDLQKLQSKSQKITPSNKSEAIHKASEDSPLTTPPLSIGQHLSQIGAQQRSPHEDPEVNRQTFQPKKKDDDTMQLFNQDDRVDNLRSQSPSQKQHQRVHSMQVPGEQRSNPSQQHLKDENFLSQSTVKQPTLDEQQQSMMQSLQQLISQSIDKGMIQLIQHNQSIVNAQKEEINAMMIQQQQLINQSLLNRSGISYQETPRKASLIDSLATPFRERLTRQSPYVAGITSVKSRRHMIDYSENPISKSVRKDQSSGEDSEPADPELSDDQNQQKVKTVQNKKQTGLRQLMTHARKPSTSFIHETREKSDESKQTIKRDDYIQGRFSLMGLQNAKQTSVQNRKVPVDSALLNFQDEQLFFPPPERWIANEYAFFEEPVVSKKSPLMDFGDHNKQEQPDDNAVCIRDSACQLKGSALKIKEGAKVKILEHFAHINMYKLLYKGQQGLFPVKDFTKVLRRKLNADYNAAKALDQMSPIHPVESKNFFKEVPERELNSQMGKLTQTQIAKTSQRILEQDHQELKQQNLKMLERQQRKLKKQRKNNF